MANNIRVYFMMFMMLSMMFTYPIMIAQNTYANNPQANNPQITERRDAASDFCGPINVRESLVLSIVTMCLGGVLNKAQEWKEIKCRATVCYYEAIKNNLDPSFCTDQQAFLTCSYVVGEMFALPPMSVLEYFRGAIANLLANPVGVLWGAGAVVARKTITAACAPRNPGTCNARIHGPQAIFLAVTDIAGVAQTIKQMLENGFFNFGGNQVDYCGQLPDIKREMEEILGIR